VSFINGVSPDFFGLLDVPIRRGRVFTDVEAREGAPVAVVSEATAGRLWPGEDPVGATLYLAQDDSTPPRSVRVIGVVGNMTPGLVYGGRQAPWAFLPASLDESGSSLLVRVRGDVERAKLRIEEELTERFPGALTDLHTLDEAVALQIYPLRAGNWVALALAG